MKEIYLAGGCFWGVEEYMSRIDGIVETRVGYANGIKENPTYKEVCTGTTGHAETTYVKYDESIISLEELLNRFWQIIDPTILNRQGPDIGNQYRTGIYYVDSQDINVINNNLSEIYLASTQPVYWDDKEKVIELAQNLTKGKNTDKEKIESIYKYIVNNIKYDYNKIKGLSNDYVPEIHKVLADKSGICYDYAALFAGMLRSLGIPTKLVKGYKSDLKEYHAWNQVFLDGKWVVIDTTYDAALKKDNVKISMIKDAIEYNNVREY
mgnify:CR=1 FL=1